MISAWTKHLKNQEDKEEFEKYIRGSRRLLERLEILLSEMNQDVENSETSPRSYDNPNWAYRQAHANGFKQCVKMIQKLITLDQEQTIDRELIRRSDNSGN